MSKFGHISTIVDKSFQGNQSLKDILDSVNIEAYSDDCHLQLMNRLKALNKSCDQIQSNLRRAIILEQTRCTLINGGRTFNSKCDIQSMIDETLNSSVELPLMKQCVA